MFVCSDQSSSPIVSPRTFNGHQSVHVYVVAHVHGVEPPFIPMENILHARRSSLYPRCTHLYCWLCSTQLPVICDDSLIYLIKSARVYISRKPNIYYTCKLAYLPLLQGPIGYPRVTASEQMLWMCSARDSYTCEVLIISRYSPQMNWHIIVSFIKFVSQEHDFICKADHVAGSSWT